MLSLGRPSASSRLATTAVRGAVPMAGRAAALGHRGGAGRDRGDRLAPGHGPRRRLAASPTTAAARALTSAGEDDVPAGRASRRSSNDNALRFPLERRGARRDPQRAPDPSPAPETTSWSCATRCSTTWWARRAAARRRTPGWRRTAARARPGGPVRGRPAADDLGLRLLRPDRGKVRTPAPADRRSLSPRPGPRRAVGSVP